MKREFRIPTDQFAYINLELGDNDSLTGSAIQEAISDYKRATEAYRASGDASGPGLDTKEWNRVLDEVLTTSKLVDGADLWEKMDGGQRNILQEIKKSIKRRN